MSVYSKVMLDVIGVAALGVELDSISSSSSFQECYHRVFEQSTASQIISLMSMYLPVRRVLPFEANLGFVRANAEIRRMLREIIRQRIKQMEARGGKATKSSAEGDRDLLTFMIDEAYVSDHRWSEDDILGHVSLFRNYRV
jgi:cytochrome P450